MRAGTSGWARTSPDILLCLHFLSKAIKKIKKIHFPASGLSHFLRLSQNFVMAVFGPGPQCCASQAHLISLQRSASQNHGQAEGCRWRLKKEKLSIGGHAGSQGWDLAQPGSNQVPKIEIPKNQTSKKCQLCKIYQNNQFLTQNIAPATFSDLFWRLFGPFLTPQNSVTVQPPKAVAGR